MPGYTVLAVTKKSAKEKFFMGFPLVFIVNIFPYTRIPQNSDVVDSFRYYTCTHH